MSSHPKSSITSKIMASIFPKRRNSVVPERPDYFIAAKQIQQHYQSESTDINATALTNVSGKRKAKPQPKNCSINNTGLQKLPSRAPSGVASPVGSVSSSGSRHSHYSSMYSPEEKHIRGPNAPTENSPSKGPPTAECLHKHGRSGTGSRTSSGAQEFDWMSSMDVARRSKAPAGNSNSNSNSSKSSGHSSSDRGGGVARQLSIPVGAPPVTSSAAAVAASKLAADVQLSLLDERINRLQVATSGSSSTKGSANNMIFGTKIDKSPEPVAMKQKTSNGLLCCDKCDGKHDTDKCPYYKKGREKHPDGQKGKSLSCTSLLPGSLLRNARVVRQPGDGSCLFHSMSYGLGGGNNANRLRGELCAFIKSNGGMLISDSPLSDWVKWDTGMSACEYARHMARGSWGGGIEMACTSMMKGCNVHVYERHGSGFKRISAFDHPSKPEDKPIVRVLYCGGVHYDALVA